MKIELTSKSIYQVTGSGGDFSLNLSPLNHGAGHCGMGVGFASVDADGKLANTISDLVGIVGLGITGYPRVPRIHWDSREHHYWDAFEGVFEPRNVVVNAPTVEFVGNSDTVQASYYYIANYVKTTVAWIFREAAFVAGKPTWDTVITIENLTGQTLHNYLHFFACYHPANPNYFWNSAGAIAPCSAGGFIAVADADQQRRLQASTYQRTVDRYCGNQKIEYFRYRQPVLLSERQPWYADARHVLMVEPEKCAAIVTWVNQARDYMIRPPHYDLQPGELFTTRIRHAIASIQDVRNLEVLWSGFKKDCQPV